MFHRVSKTVCFVTLFVALLMAYAVLTAPTALADDGCIIPDSGPWPACATGGNAATAGDDIVGPNQDCIIPESGPWPSCATGNDTGTTTGDCVIPASGPWPSCATGGSTPMPVDSSTGDCVIPASGPWPPCATGSSSPAPTPNTGNDCVIPTSGPWPPCATDGSGTPAATDPAPQSNPYSITNIKVVGVGPYEATISFDYSVPEMEHFFGFSIYDPDTCFGECPRGIATLITTGPPYYFPVMYPFSGSVSTSLYVDYIKCAWGPATTSRLLIEALYQAPYSTNHGDPAPILAAYVQVVEFNHTWCE